jgi:hypothetical protein
MQRKAEECGLRFTDRVHPDPDAFTSRIIDSYAEFFLKGRFRCWFIKKASQIITHWQPWFRPVLDKGHEYHGDREPEHETLDESVVRRWHHKPSSGSDKDRYRPANLRHLVDRDLAARF